MDRLECGMEVEVLSLGTRGVIVEVQNDQQLGRVRSPSGADFTVFAAECVEANRPIDPLDRMFCETVGLEVGREVLRTGRPSWRPLCERLEDRLLGNKRVSA